jgi:hypothetical protein
MMLFGEENVPLWLVLCEDLPFRVIPNVADIDVAAQIELLCAELRHIGGGWSRLRLRGWMETSDVEVDRQKFGYFGAANNLWSGPTSAPSTMCDFHSHLTHVSLSSNVHIKRPQSIHS